MKRRQIFLDLDENEIEDGLELGTYLFEAEDIGSCGDDSGPGGGEGEDTMEKSEKEEEPAVMQSKSFSKGHSLVYGEPIPQSNKARRPLSMLLDQAEAGGDDVKHAAKKGWSSAAAPLFSPDKGTSPVVVKKARVATSKPAAAPKPKPVAKAPAAPKAKPSAGKKKRALESEDESEKDSDNESVEVVAPRAVAPRRAAAMKVTSYVTVFDDGDEDDKDQDGDEESAFADDDVVAMEQDDEEEEVPKPAPKKKAPAAPKPKPAPKPKAALHPLQFMVEDEEEDDSDDSDDEDDEDGTDNNASSAAPSLAPISKTPMPSLTEQVEMLFHHGYIPWDLVEELDDDAQTPAQRARSHKLARQLMIHKRLWTTKDLMDFAPLLTDLKAFIEQDISSGSDAFTMNVFKPKNLGRKDKRAVKVVQRWALGQVDEKRVVDKDFLLHASSLLGDASQMDDTKDMDFSFNISYSTIFEVISTGDAALLGTDNRGRPLKTTLELVFNRDGEPRHEWSKVEHGRDIRICLILVLIARWKRFWAAKTKNMPIWVQRSGRLILKADHNKLAGKTGGEGAFGDGCGKGPANGTGAQRQPPESGRKIIDHSGHDMKFTATLKDCGCTVSDKVGHLRLADTKGRTTLRLHLGRTHKSCHKSKNYQPPVDSVTVRQLNEDGSPGCVVELTIDEVVAAMDGRKLLGYVSV